MLLESVPVDITLVVWLETGRHSAALWCIIRGRVAEVSELRGIKVSAEVKGWQLIPTVSREVRRIGAPQIRVLFYRCLKGLFRSHSLHIYIRKALKRQEGACWHLYRRESPLYMLIVFSQGYCFIIWTAFLLLKHNPSPTGKLVLGIGWG